MDRISSVPDEIIGHILSFLSAKEAVSTSVLSKRWRNLYALSPNLHLDEFHYQNPNSSTSFIDFVDNIFAVSGNSPLKQFTLKRRQQSVDATRVNSWICNVLTRGVLDLNLFIAGNDKYSLPLEVFSCKTIVNLKLGMGFCIDMVPESLSLPALKTLFLDHIGFSSKFQALISACHVLEELTMRVDDCIHWKRTISSPTLQRLIITCQVCKACDRYGHRRITFDTPNLSYLEYCDTVSNGDQFVNFDSLLEAKLSFDSCTGNPRNLFNGLRNVEILELSSYETSKMFDSFKTEIPVFLKLLRLSVRTNSSLCCPAMQILVETSPNLHTLHLKGSSYDDSSSGDTHRNGCFCLWEYSYVESYPLKVLEITEYKGTEDELVHMKRFLDELQCLEVVKIWSGETDHTKQLQLTNDLLRLGRPSKCKIHFEFIPSELLSVGK